jgi:hypothetical protein
MSPTKLVIRGLLAVILTVAFVIVCLWWYYRPTIEAGSAGLSSRTESISIPSISLGIPPAPADVSRGRGRAVRDPEVLPVI